MYFWRIEKLKAELATRPLTDRETLPYLVYFVGWTTAASFIPATFTNVWDGLGAAWSVLLAVIGTLYIYRRNGGADGQYFLQRYFAIGWVVAIRWLVILVLAIVAFVGVLTALGSEAEDTTWYEFLFLAIAEAVIYWRTDHHVGDVANRTKPD